MFSRVLQSSLSAGHPTLARALWELRAFALLEDSSPGSGAATEAPFGAGALPMHRGPEHPHRVPLKITRSRRPGDVRPHEQICVCPLLRG